jgi:hypothetical protein
MKSVKQRLLTKTFSVENTNRLSKTIDTTDNISESPSMQSLQQQQPQPKNIVRQHPRPSYLKQNVHPSLEWEDSEITQHSNYSDNLDERYIEKIFFKKKDYSIASCQIYDKFSDDYFDDYLFEIGILFESRIKFDDKITEIDLMLKCKHKNIIEFYDAYYHENILYVCFFI